MAPKTALTIGFTLWFLLFCAVSLAGQLDRFDLSYPLTTGLVRFLKAFVFWLGLCSVVFLFSFLLYLPQGAPAAKTAAGAVEIAGIVFAAAPALFGIFILVSSPLMPWDVFPGGPSPALKPFASRHPGLEVVEGGASGLRVFTPSFNIPYEKWDLQDANMRIDTCTPDTDLPPAFPGSSCLARVRLELAEKPEKNHEANYETWVYQPPKRDLPPICGYYEAWMGRSGVTEITTNSGSRSKGSYVYWEAKFKRGEADWRIAVQGRPASWMYIYVRRPRTLSTPVER